MRMRKTRAQLVAGLEMALCALNDAREARTKAEGKAVSLREEFDGMCRLSTAKNIEIQVLQEELKTARIENGGLGITVAALRANLAQSEERISAASALVENLTYKLQLNQDEYGRMAKAVTLNDTTIGELKAELTAAKEQIDPYFEARFRNECRKTQGLSQKLWEQDAKLETYRVGEISLRKEYDDLVVRYERDASLWKTGWRLSSKISALGDKFVSENYEALDARVRRVERMHRWPSSDPAWDFHSETNVEAETGDNLLTTGLKDLHERVAALEALGWQEGEGG